MGGEVFATVPDLELFGNDDGGEVMEGIDILGNSNWVWN